MSSVRYPEMFPTNKLLQHHLFLASSLNNADCLMKRNADNAKKGWRANVMQNRMIHSKDANNN
jgi:hypothetical protein